MRREDKMQIPQIAQMRKKGQPKIAGTKKGAVMSAQVLFSPQKPSQVVSRKWEGARMKQSSVSQGVMMGFPSVVGFGLSGWILPVRFRGFPPRSTLHI